MYWLAVIFFKLKVKDLNLFTNNFFPNFQRGGGQALCSRPLNEGAFTYQLQ